MLPSKRISSCFRANHFNFGKVKFWGYTDFVLTKREAERQRQAERTQNPAPKAGTCREIFRVYAKQKRARIDPKHSKRRGKSIRKSTQTRKRRGRLKEMAYALKRTPEDPVATQVVGMG